MTYSDTTNAKITTSIPQNWNPNQFLSTHFLWLSVQEIWPLAICLLKRYLESHIFT